MYFGLASIGIVVLLMESYILGLHDAPRSALPISSLVTQTLAKRDKLKVKFNVQYLILIPKLST